LKIYNADQIKKIADELNIVSSKKSSKKVLIERILAIQNKQSSPTGINFKPNKIGSSYKYYKQNSAVYISLFIIQINKSNLLDYFGSALIYPVNYETRELAKSQRTKDIQLFWPNHLLILDGFTDELNEQQVLLEVSLTDFDKRELIKLHEKVYILPHPLPISRINKIYFANKES
jgi:hypothetical protein